MKRFGIFLTFNGKCRQALKHYQKCFGGELTLQIVGDMPDSENCSKAMKKVVVSAVLTNKYFKVVGTDLADNYGVVFGNNIGILVECISDADRNRINDFLSGGKNDDNATGDNLINVTDKYKVNWILIIK